jgi:glutaredoxin
MAKEFFEENGIVYKNYDVSLDLEKRQEMINLTGQMGVPVILIDGEVIVGFDEDRIREELGMD